MAQQSDPAWLDATAQAELVRSGEVKPIELVDAAIDRIERLNPELNAVITPMYEEARAAATGDLPDGPFTGVPILLKDLLASYAGVRMTLATKLMRDYVPDHDSELVVRLKRAGSIVVGKTNLPELGLMATTEPQLFGPTRNPWDTGRTPGGSSGGSAAAVAAGMVPMAHGNDAGGSIRIPASCCGLFGLKPTRARNSLAPDFGDLQGGLVVEHALTRSVRDSAALLDATSGHVPGDPYWAPPPARPFLDEVGIDPGRLRIAFVTAANDDVSIHPDCVSAVQDAAGLCAKLGHDVSEADWNSFVDGRSTARALHIVWVSSLSFTVESLGHAVGKEPERDMFEPLTWSLYEEGRNRKAAEYLYAVHVIRKAARRVAAFFSGCDVLLTPTLGEPPVPLGTFAGTADDPRAGYRRAAGFIPFTPVFNMTGQPAMSVPLYWNEAGLPIGTQFVAGYGNEATLFRLAAQLESARPWADKRPPISV